MLEGLLATYRARNKRSHALFTRAQESLPGGNTRTTQYFAPFPCYADHGEGKYLIDVDGNRRLDLGNNMASLILGHADPDVVRAIQAQAARGTAWAAQSETDIIWAEQIKARVPAIETLRFTNSGTEATLQAIRTARAYTDKVKVAKCEGGMHGSHDAGQFSVRPPANLLSGPRHRPAAVPAMAGLSEGMRREMVILPFNDPEAAAELIHEHRHDLACVIVEPVQGVAGMLPATREYLQALRRATAAAGVLLIFDEVMSLRVAVGGAQAYYGVEPDLTATGKIIGGGLPVGAFGGRRDVMRVLDPTLGLPLVNHSGTFCANPVTAAAGIAALQKLDAAAIAHLNRLGDRVRSELNRVFAAHGLPGHVTGLGSLFHIHFTAREPVCVRDTLDADQALLQQLFFWLHNHDVLILPRGMCSLSLPMDDGDIDRLVSLVAAFAEQAARERREAYGHGHDH